MGLFDESPTDQAGWAGRARVNSGNLEDLFRPPGTRQEYNPGYDYGQVTGAGLTNPVNIHRGQTLSDVQSYVQGTADKNANYFSRLLSMTDLQRTGQASGGVNYLKDLQTNNTSRLDIMTQLEQKFGPAWRSNPEAQAIMSQFTNQLTLNRDAETIRSLVSAGKKVEDYLSTDQFKTVATPAGPLYNTFGSIGLYRPGLQ